MAAEVIGVYDEPPPADAGDVIRSTRVANIGAVPLLERTTHLRDELLDRVGHLLELVE